MRVFPQHLQQGAGAECGQRNRMACGLDRREGFRHGLALHFQRAAGFASADAPHIRTAHAVALGQLHAAFAAGPNGYNVLVGKFGLRQTHAGERVAMHLTVKRVLLRVAKVEVMGVDTGLIAAAVQHHGAAEDGANKQAVRKAVTTRFTAFTVRGKGVAPFVFMQPIWAKALLF